MRVNGDFSSKLCLFNWTIKGNGKSSPSRRRRKMERSRGGSEPSELLMNLILLTQPWIRPLNLYGTNKLTNKASARLALNAFITRSSGSFFVEQKAFTLGSIQCFKTFCQNHKSIAGGFFYSAGASRRTSNFCGIGAFNNLAFSFINSTVEIEHEKERVKKSFLGNNKNLMSKNVSLGSNRDFFGLQFVKPYRELDFIMASMISFYLTKIQLNTRWNTKKLIPGTRRQCQLTASLECHLPSIYSACQMNSSLCSKTFSFRMCRAIVERMRHKTVREWNVPLHLLGGDLEAFAS